MGRVLDWRLKYARRLAVVDAAVIVWAVAGAYLVRFGIAPGSISSPQDETYGFLSVALSIVWWLMMTAWNTRETRILGSGNDEYKRVAAASLWLFGLVAIVSYTVRFDTARGYVGFALPVGLVALLLSRWLLRQHLGVERKSGRSMSRLMLIGGRSAVAHLATSLLRSPKAGYLPIAVYIPGVEDETATALDPGLPVYGHAPETTAILDAIAKSGADAVAMSAGVQLHPQTIRHLGWELASRNISLIMAPALTDIAGPRIHTQPVAGLPLIHVTTPTLEGGQRVAKRMFDLLVSCSLIFFTAPLLALLALLVKWDSPGPILFRQERVGIEGKHFKMLKFRSMVINAEERLADLASQNEGNGLLFKIKDDPRVTRIGKFIRKYSLDELPQLFNIFEGSMSLVGPRPPLPSEVAAYEHDVRRRLLVKPGLTGLWQVSGRSNLSWQDSVRLDLYYVENWSLTGDLVILLRTARAVFGGKGAY